MLAMLYMARGEQENAKKTVDFGLKVLQYQGVKSGYVLALLRGRLKSDFAAGWAKRLYDEAEKLRQKGKFVEAGELFAQVRAMYSGLGAPARGKGVKGEGVPASEWGHAAGFRIGQCYLGLNHPSQAIDWWQKFIKESPTGPWRGQAQVAIVDLALQSELNLKKAAEHATAAADALANRCEKVVGNKAAVSSHGAAKGHSASPPPDADLSWKEAAYDIYLRQGIVSLIGSRFDVAADAFEQAKQSAPSGTSHEIQLGLDRLIESSKRE